jgi:hypothetical protein
MLTKRQPTDKLNVNLGGMLLVVVLFLVGTYYAITAFSANDALWFLKGFHAQPSRLIIYHDGQQTEIKKSDPAFAALASAVQKSIDNGVNSPSGMGFSQSSLDDAKNLYVSLEAYFDQPVKIHAPFSTGEPTQMLFPITGRHSDLNIVLLGENGVYSIDPPVLTNMEPIRTVLQSMGYGQ